MADEMAEKKLLQGVKSEEVGDEMSAHEMAGMNRSNIKLKIKRLMKATPDGPGTADYLAGYLYGLQLLYDHINGIPKRAKSRQGGQ